MSSPYTPSPATFGQFILDTRTPSLITYVSTGWLIRVNTSSPWQPMNDDDAIVCSQAQFNQSLYTATTPWSVIKTDSFKNTKLYLGYYAYVGMDGKLNCGSQQIKAVADPTLAQDVATKAYTDATVNVQKARIDTIMVASTTDADSFAEIVTSVNAVAATGATNLLNATAAIQTENTAQNVRITALELQVGQLYQKLYQKDRTETIL